MKQRRTSLKDLAAQLGVSIATVSGSPAWCQHSYRFTGFAQ